MVKLGRLLLKVKHRLNRLGNLQHLLLVIIGILAVLLVVCAVYSRRLDDFLVWRRTKMTENGISGIIEKLRNINYIKDNIKLPLYNRRGGFESDENYDFSNELYTENMMKHIVNGQVDKRGTETVTFYGNTLIDTTNKPYIIDNIIMNKKYSTKLKEPQNDIKNETEKSVNPLEFDYIINEKEVCKNLYLYMLVYVYTAVSHFEYRRVIRKTWANPNVTSKLNYTVIFVLGKHDNPYIMTLIQKESLKYHDIIQENYVDSYRNLSLKGLSALKWVTKYCPDVPYILKIDDDMIFNVYTIREYLKEFGSLYADKKMILGLVNSGMWVDRNVSSKLFIPTGKFKSNHFPAYCAGAAYMMTSYAVKAIYNISFGEVYLHIEDVFITGILAKKAGVMRAQIQGRYEFKTSYLAVLCEIHNIFPDSVFFAMVNQPSVIEIFWKYIQPYEKLPGHLNIVMQQNRM